MSEVDGTNTEDAVNAVEALGSRGDTDGLAINDEAGGEGDRIGVCSKFSRRTSEDKIFAYTQFRRMSQSRSSRSGKDIGEIDSEHCVINAHTTVFPVLLLALVFTYFLSAPTQVLELPEPDMRNLVLG